MYTYITMTHRTQITLTNQQYERLQEESRLTGASLAELVRRAVDATYRDRPTDEGFRQALDATFGLWRDRGLEDGAEYVEKLRPGLRVAEG